MLISRSKFYLRTALLALAVPALCLPASVNINGTTVNFNGSTSGNFSQSVTVNGDTYDVTGSYAASYDGGGTHISINPTVTYTGATPTTTNDAITISYSQAYFDNSPGTWDGLYHETIPVNIFGNVGAGSSLTGELSYDGQGLGPLTGSSGVLTASQNLTGLTGDTLNALYSFTYNLNAGTTTGSGANSPASGGVPEPAEALPVGLGLAGIMYAVARRRRSGESKKAA